MKQAPLNALAWQQHLIAGVAEGLFSDLMKHQPFTIGTKRLSATTRHKVFMSDEDRMNHIYTLGQSKSEQKQAMIRWFSQDMENGKGCAFLDPTGRLAKELLRNVPTNRLEQVVYFDVSNLENIVSVNPLYNVPPHKQSLVVSNILEIFERIWFNGWGPRMEDAFRACLFILLDQPASVGVSLASIPQFLNDVSYRNRLLRNSNNTTAKEYFINEYGRMRENDQQQIRSPILNKVRAFLIDPVPRNIFSPTVPSFDLFRAVADNRIVIVNLNQTKIGSKNARLIGSLLTTMLRMGATETQTPYFLYLNEAHTFITKDLMTGLAGDDVGYVLAHTYSGQIDADIQKAISETVKTFCAFSLGDNDAELYRDKLFPTPKEILTVPLDHCCIARVMSSGEVSPVVDLEVPPHLPFSEVDHTDHLLRVTRQQFSYSVKEIERKEKLGSRSHREKFPFQRIWKQI